MKIKTMIVLAALLCGLLMVGGGVWAMSSGSYAINWDVIGGGGEPASSTNYAIEGTIGQPAAESSFSTNYGLWSGYWYPCRMGGVCQDEPSPEVGFASLIAEGKLVIAYNFDPFTTVPTAVNGWTWYDPTLPPSQNNLYQLYLNTAYWVKVTEECWLTYGTQTHHLAAGWNNPVWLGC